MGALTARVFYIVNILLVACLIAANHYIGVPFWWYIILALLSVSYLFFACINLSWSFFIPSLCHAETSERVVALSFDDGPAAYTGEILDVLRKEGVEASFFCIGRNISGKEDTLRRLHAEGHVIGNHSFSHHFWFDMWGAAKMTLDMADMDKEVQRATGLKPLLFRPPYGVINPNLAAAIRRGGYTTIGWSVRSFDTSIKDEQKLLSRITDSLAPGDVILLHDSMAITAAILPELIGRIKAKGFNIIRLDKMLNIAPYA